LEKGFFGGLINQLLTDEDLQNAYFVTVCSTPDFLFFSKRGEIPDVLDMVGLQAGDEFINKDIMKRT